MGVGGLEGGSDSVAKITRRYSRYRHRKLAIRC